ncbi:MAG: putative acyl-CoA dehydrogenase [Myxococcaceae bacterium]|nr:putative acyl-CoA dehydrogenase [Myxococcaceae bacterium]
MTSPSSVASFVDRARPVRTGEELDVAKVASYLARVEPSLQGVPELTQFPGGASNLTYLLTYPDGRELVLRRPPFGHRAKSAHDMMREARVMQALAKVYPYVPRVVALCDDLSVLDVEFFVMERIRGIIPRTNLPKGMTLDAPSTRTLCVHVIDKLVELHQIDHVAAGLSNLGKGEGYVARQIKGWSERYTKARTPNVGDYEQVMRWLADKMPASEVAICVVHNDFRFDNVVLDPADPMRVIGVLDWEMATLGDPLMDLGNTLAYWVQADDTQFRQLTRRQPTHLPGMLSRAEVVEYYGQKTGLRVDNFDFYEVYGLFRLAVIVQQIYYRYHHGQTTNPEFAAYYGLTQFLEAQCQELIAKSKL